MSIDQTSLNEALGKAFPNDPVSAIAAQKAIAPLLNSARTDDNLTLTQHTFTQKVALDERQRLIEKVANLESRVDFHKTMAESAREQVKSVWDRLAQMVAWYTGKPCSSESLKDLRAILSQNSSEANTLAGFKGANAGIKRQIELCRDAGTQRRGRIRQ